MNNNGISSATRKFLTGLFTGLFFGCVLGFVLGVSNKTDSGSSDANVIFTETPTVAFAPTTTATPITTNNHLSDITETPTPHYKPTITGLPSPAFLTIPYISCGDHVAYSATAETTEISIIEDDKIIEYATYVLITYKVRNTYINTPIYGFEVRPSPGYDNPALYPHKSPMFVSDPLIQPNEEVTLRSEHLFVPDTWNFEEHPNAFWKFPEEPRFHPYPYESAIGGYIVSFQIYEMFNFSKPEEKRCEGAIRIK